MHIRTSSSATPLGNQPPHREAHDWAYRLDRGSAVPLHQQLTDAIRTLIRSGTWSAASRVPSEREMLSLFGVSRITVRTAFDALAREGFLVRSSGRGTFVAARPERVVRKAIGDASPHGQEPGPWFATSLVETVPPRVRSALDLSWDAHLTRLSRLRVTKSPTSVLETVYLSAERCPEIGTRHEAEPLYRTLAREFGIVPVRATLHTEAILCPPMEAHQLGLEAVCPVIRRMQTTFELDGRPFEYVESLIAGVDHSLILLNGGDLHG
jgi:GntR family transcriptional regulator